MKEMNGLFVSILLLVFVQRSWSIVDKDVNVTHLPEEDMKADELIRYNGYPAEVHEVYTADGYILTMQRIPHGRNGSRAGLRRPVLLQHGLAASASNWLTNLPNKSLAYILADNGYDVWLGNVRGNTYSSKHVNMTIVDPPFWDFSWENMAEFDLPAMIKYVTTITRFRQIVYIGHSQGTLIAFAKLPTDPTLSKKIKKFIALAPVTTVGSIKSPVRTLVPFCGAIHTALKVFGDYSLGGLRWLKRYLQRACESPVGKLLCESLIFYLVGPESKSNLNETRIPVYLAHNPDDTSTKNIVHFCQMIKSKKMQRYDYGYFYNWMKYGQFSPPEYELEGMNVSTTLFWSPEDALADAGDVELLVMKLKSVTVHRVEGYSHIDFLWADSAAEQIYSKIIAELRS